MSLEQSPIFNSVIILKDLRKYKFSSVMLVRFMKQRQKKKNNDGDISVSLSEKDADGFIEYFRGPVYHENVISGLRSCLPKHIGNDC